MSDSAETTDDAGHVDTDGLLSRIRLIEDQPLEQRAAAFTQLHEQLQAALEGADRS